jgi:hypothetical protein
MGYGTNQQKREPKMSQWNGPKPVIFFLGGVSPHTVSGDNPLAPKETISLTILFVETYLARYKCYPWRKSKGLWHYGRQPYHAMSNRCFFPSSNRATKYCNHMCWSPNPRFAHVMWYERHRWRPVGLHHIKPCFWMHIISPYIALTIGLIYGRCLNFRYLKWAALPTSSASLF